MSRRSRSSSVGGPWAVLERARRRAVGALHGRRRVPGVRRARDAAVLGVGVAVAVPVRRREDEAHVPAAVRRVGAGLDVLDGVVQRDLLRRGLLLLRFRAPHGARRSARGVRRRGRCPRPRDVRARRAVSRRRLPGAGALLFAPLATACKRQKKLATRTRARGRLPGRVEYMSCGARETSSRAEQATAGVSAAPRPLPGPQELPQGRLSARRAAEDARRRAAALALGTPGEAGRRGVAPARAAGRPPRRAAPQGLAWW